MAISDISSPVRARIISDVYKNWVHKNDKVLDIGCGNGVVAYELKNSLGIEIYGCDTDRYLTRKIKFKNMQNNSKIPFDKHEFDLSMFNDVLHHTSFNNQMKLIQEALRVSKAVLVFELKPTNLGKFLDFVLNKIHNLNMNIPFTYRSSREWEKLFKENKIYFFKREVYTPSWYPFAHVAYKLTKGVK